jgi:predicted metal-dependent peptidase
MDPFAPIRLRAAHLRPYFALALFALHKVDAKIGTMAVDKFGRVYIDPDKVREWGPEASAYVLLHEVEHWLRAHHERGQSYLDAAECKHCEASFTNVCMDMEINDDPELIRHLPGDPPTPQKAKLQPGRLWEEYYEQLKAKQKKQQSPHQHVVLVNCGSAAHGQTQPYELPAPGGEGSVESGKKKDRVPGMQGAEAEMLRRAVAREVQQAADKEPGKVPAGLLRWAQALLAPPQVPWEKELAALIRRARVMAMGAVDYTYAKISRRAGFRKPGSRQVLTPAMRRPTPDVAVVLDTSGSMGEDDMSASLTEVVGIVRATGQVTIPVICCDAQAGPVQRVSRSLQLEITGGGGTDMGVGIAAAEQLGVGVIIVLTDGYTPWPSQAPRGQLVVGLVRQEAQVQGWDAPSYAKRWVHIKPRVRQAA